MRIACHACPGFGSCGGMFTYNTMQTFIGVVGMQPLHMVAPPSDDPRRLERVPGRAGGPPGQAHGEGPEAARHRRARFHPQRGDRRDGHRRLDQRDAARARDRARRRLCRLLEGDHDAGGVQSPLAACRARAHRRAALRQVLHGRHRRGRRRAGDRARAAGGRAAERRCPDLYGRNPRAAGRAPRRQTRRRQGDLSRREALQADRRPARARRQPVAGFLRDPEARRRRQWPPEQRGDEQGPDLRGRPREQCLPRQSARVRG